MKQTEQSNPAPVPPKRYTLYTFPSSGGSPRQFRFRLTAWVAAKLSAGVCELKDNLTGEYFAFWA